MPVLVPVWHTHTNLLGWLQVACWNCTVAGTLRLPTGRFRPKAAVQEKRIGPKTKFIFETASPQMRYLMKILKSSLAFLFSLAIAGCMTTQTAPTIAAKADGSCSTSPGGACYTGPGGPMYAGPGGAASAGPGGPMYAGPGGAMYAGPGGPLYAGPGGTRDSGPGGAAYAGPGGACYAGPGRACNATNEAIKQCSAICKPVASAVSATN